MDGRLVRRLSLTTIIIFLFYVLFFYSPEESLGTSERELENTPLDDMVWRFIYGVRNCLRMETDLFDKRQNNFLHYWHRLPAISDACGVNPQMSIRAYSTKQQFNFYFIPNMNKTIQNDECTIVSYVAKKFPELETKLRRENPSCSIHNFDVSETCGGTTGIKCSKSEFEDLSKRLNSLGRLNSLYIQPSSKDVYSLVKLISSDASICQVNLLYPEPTASVEHQFVSSFNKLLTEVNFSDEYCRKRYFRMYTFD